jgi:UBA/TS-N domain
MSSTAAAVASVASTSVSTIAAALPSFSDTKSVLQTNFQFFKEKFLFNSPEDPVFSGILRDFNAFDKSLNLLFTKCIDFENQLSDLSTSLETLSQTVEHQFLSSEDPLIKQDSIKYFQATNKITKTDAPHSVIAKFKRDLEFNVSVPLKSHLLNNKKIKQLSSARNDKLVYLTSIQKQFDSSSDPKKPIPSDLQKKFEDALQDFVKVDEDLSDWLFISLEYKDDIFDSLLQTLKYLQYEFFASAAHEIASVLPPRMEFRPLVEMTPKQLESQIKLEREERKVLEQERQAEEQEEGSSNAAPIADYSAKVIDRMERSKLVNGEETVVSSVSVDPMSLSVLVAQGFNESDARKALKFCANDPQAALEFLINPPKPDLGKNAVKVETEDGEEYYVRVPSTLARIQRLKEVKRKIQNKTEQKEKVRSSNEAEKTPPASEKIQDLLDFDDSPLPALPAKKSLMDDDFWNSTTNNNSS